MRGSLLFFIPILVWHSAPIRYKRSHSIAGGRDLVLWSYGDYLNSVF